jgi:hypothetical protein
MSELQGGIMSNSFFDGPYPYKSQQEIADLAKRERDSCQGAFNPPPTEEQIAEQRKIEAWANSGCKGPLNLSSPTTSARSLWFDHPDPITKHEREIQYQAYKARLSQELNLILRG